MSIRNLKEETITVLRRHNKEIKDIKWIGCSLFKIPINEFFKLANKTYDSGYGGAEVAEDLLIIGEDWWLERHEYDGSEWWEYKTLPVEPKYIQDVPTLFPKKDTNYENLFLSDYFKYIEEYNRHDY